MGEIDRMNKMILPSDCVDPKSQHDEDLDAAHQTLQVKISRNGEDLRVLDEETALLLEDIKEC